MTKYEAKKVLDDMNPSELTGPALFGMRMPYVSALRAAAFLDGEFTADELEAIAIWMRDPAGVVEAKEGGN